MDNKRETIASQRIVRKMLLSGGLALALLGVMIAGLNAAQAHTIMPSIPHAVSALARSEDPIVITGSLFPVFSDVPVNELVVYAYRGGDWQAVPFQIDEVNISGTYVISDGGLLDANDELVFMAGDAGDQVGAAVWPSDAQSRLYARYAITVSDPLSASQQAWAYLYRSTTLTRSNVSYITWTHGVQTASAVSYTAAFSPTRFVGLSDLFINGRAADVLDRQKLRLTTILGTLNEETIVTFLGAATVTLPIAGPVRAATNEGDLKAAFYGSRLDFDVTFNLSALPLAVNPIRTSFDWISPTISGINTYYDSNTPSGASIDGVPDTISTAPRINWFQINGGASGPGGLVMTIPRIDPRGGTVTNYYKDNSAIDASDTGDQRSFGDAGLVVNDPGTIVSFTLVSYILPPGTNTNVGSGYFARAGNPLRASVEEEHYPFGPPLGVTVTGATLARVDDPQTYVAGVNPVSVTLPMTYVWQVTDHPLITVTGNLSSSATFTWTTYGLKDISVTAYNIYGSANSDPLSVLVGRPIFLPLILKGTSF